MGAFPDGMRGPRKRGMDDAIRQFANTGRPLLGICLGMQMLAKTSDEFGEHRGLNIMPGKVSAIPSKNIECVGLKIPYVGWSTLDRPNQVSSEGTVLAQLTSEQAVYFVHSYHFKPGSEANILATYQYGGHDIIAALVKENVIGLQFHPEKSGEVGLRIISNFLQS